jgi:hypothetical protein
MDRAKLEELRRTEAQAKREWEQAVQAVRIANEAVSAAHHKYMQAWKALEDLKASGQVRIRPPQRSTQRQALAAKAS